jgi:hypothetical protein
VYLSRSKPHLRYSRLITARGKSCSNEAGAPDFAKIHAIARLAYRAAQQKRPPAQWVGGGVGVIQPGWQPPAWRASQGPLNHTYLPFLTTH